MFILRLLLLFICFSVVSVLAANEPIKALLITARDLPKYSEQAKIITEGISSRCALPISWRVINASEYNLSVKYDIIVHHQPQQTGALDLLLSSHYEGIPALVLHGALHQYSKKGAHWVEFCGGEVKLSGQKQKQSIRYEAVDHSIIRSLPSDWTNLEEESSLVLSKSRKSLILARAGDPESGSIHPVFWTHIYNQKTRVFATSIGRETETIKQLPYLDLLASSFVWALNKSWIEGVLVSGSGLKKVNQTKFDLGNNLLANQTITSSSDFSERAIDGKSATAWQPSDESLSQWLFIEMDRAVKAKAVAITWGNYQDHSFRLEASVDGINWFTLVDGKVSSSGPGTTFFQCDADIKHLRLIDPINGVLNPIHEMALYSQLDDVPSHVRSFEQPSSTQEKPTFTVGIREPVLVSSVAFEILDDVNKFSQLDLAFGELGLMYRQDVVNGILSRVKSTESGMFRHKAIRALGHLYRDQEGDTWEASSSIAEYLVSELGNKRIDPELLLSVLSRHRIPVDNPSQIVGLLGRDLHLVKELKIKLLEQNGPLTPSAALFLRKLIRDEDEPVVLRVRATELLARSSALLGLQDAFTLVAKSENNQLNQARNHLLYSIFWQGQQEWLMEQTNDTSPAVRDLAWSILIQLLNDPGLDESSAKYIVEQLKEAESEQGSRLHSFLKAIKRPRQSVVIEIVKNAAESEDTKIAYTAGLLVSRNVATDQSPKQNVSAYSFEDLQTQLAKEDRSNDTAKGELLFKKHCIICHQVGPELKDLQTKFPDAALLKALIKPDAEIAEGFSSQKIELSDGSVFHGFGGNETTVAIELIDQVGNSVSLPKRSIVSQSIERGSTMPRNLLDRWNIDDLSDLMSFLERL